MVAFQPAVYSSYTDGSQRLPIAVGQPSRPVFSQLDAPPNLPIALERADLSAFSRIDSRPAVVDSVGQHYTICTPASADAVRPIVTAHQPPLPSPSLHWRKRFAYDYVQSDTGLGAPTHIAPAVHSGYIRPQPSEYLQTLSVGEGHLMTNAGLPQPHQPSSSYVPHSHVMPLQVPTVPSVMPPPSHLPFQAPITSSSETKVTYLHVPPPTHTVFADVHAPFTHASSDASASASLLSSQPQSTTVTAMHTQSVLHPAVNFNALPTGLTATADTVVPPPTQCLRQCRLLLYTVHL